MQIEQLTWNTPDIDAFKASGKMTGDAQLVFVFGCKALMQNTALIDSIRRKYEKADLIGCTTAGEIVGTQVMDNTLVATAVRFDYTAVKSVSKKIGATEDSFIVGQQLAEALNGDQLAHIFVLSEGLNVNGSELVKGMLDKLPEKVAITGGLAGDGTSFKQTLILSERYAEENTIAAVGFYGSRISIGYGSVGGWDVFGPERIITKSKHNILYELDGKSALELYKIYLGDFAKELPYSGLFFPLSIRRERNQIGLVRSILGVDEKEKSLIFGGDMPEGYYAKLMKANPDRLLFGASEAAEFSKEAHTIEAPELAVLVSCVARKAVLQQRIEEEVESIREILGDSTFFAGFYSYGEISPYRPGYTCELHNQTMTITTFRET